MPIVRKGLIGLMILAMMGCGATTDASKAEQRATIDTMQFQALQKLYGEKPDVKAQIENAAGYGIFSNANVNLLFVAAGTGVGVVKNNLTGQTTYMRMAEGGVGLGAGVKDYRLIMVFHSQDALSQFIENGWTFGGNADASAKAGSQGGSVGAEAYYGDVSVYSITESGLALQATVKGTKFWKNQNLN